jgi:hypothetical protein
MHKHETGELTRIDMDVITSALVRVLQDEKNHDTYEQTHKVFCKVMRMHAKSREEWRRLARGRVAVRKLLNVISGGA